MNRKEKQNVVDSLNQAFSTASIVIVGQNTGVTAEQASNLRSNVRNASGKTVVSKNTLAKLGAKGTDYEHIESLLKGPTMLVYSENDPVAIAKTVVNFAKSNPTLALKGAAMGAKALNVNMLKELAELPSLDQLRSKMIGLIQAPSTKVARIAQTPAQMLVTVLKAFSEK